MFSNKLKSKLNEISAKSILDITDIDSSIKINSIIGTIFFHMMILLVAYGIIKYWGNIGIIITIFAFLTAFSNWLNFRLIIRRDTIKEKLKEKLREEIAKENGIDPENIIMEEI